MSETLGQPPPLPSSFVPLIPEEPTENIPPSAGADTREMTGVPPAVASDANVEDIPPIEIKPPVKFGMKMILKKK
jgi:hypothetical protein